MFFRKALTIFGLSLWLLPIQKVVGMTEQPVESVPRMVLEQEDDNPISNFQITRQTDGLLLSWDAAADQAPFYVRMERNSNGTEIYSATTSSFQHLIPASAYTPGVFVNIGVRPDAGTLGRMLWNIEAPAPLGQGEGTPPVIEHSRRVQNLQAAIHPDGIHFTWDAFGNAASYELRINVCQLYISEGGSIYIPGDECRYFSATVSSTRYVIPISQVRVNDQYSVDLRALDPDPSYVWTEATFVVRSMDNIDLIGRSYRVVGGYGGSYKGTFLLGAIGKAYRVSDYQIDLYEIIEGTTQGVFAFRITQEEIDVALAAAGEATCVKASRNDRASVTVWADGNVTFSIGPDYETKIFHVLLEGGLGGPIIGHSTTYGPPAGAHCPN